MNNKEFINKLSERLHHNQKEVMELVSSLETTMTEHLQENDSISIAGFGSFEVKKKTERVSVNPTTGKRFLVPPKLTLAFKQSGALKDKVNVVNKQKTEED